MKRGLARAALLALGLVGLGCGAGGDPPVGSAAMPVMRAADGGDPAVVQLFAGAFGRCSGTLIDRGRVVTAAHCLDDGIDGVSLAADPSSILEVASTAVHPRFDRATLAWDAAVLVLASAPDVAPATLGEAPAVGDDVIVAGWGAGDDDGARERTGTSRVTFEDEGSFTTAPDPSQPCGGDSGGAAFAEDGGRALIGIVSRGDAACVDHATFVRVDAVADFIGSVEGAPDPSAGPVSAPGCNGSGQQPLRGARGGLLGLVLLLRLLVRRRK